MKTIIINGYDISSKKVTGIQRVIIETLKSIDAYLVKQHLDLDIRVCYPKDLHLMLPELRIIQKVPLQENRRFWEIRVLQKYVAHEKGIYCAMGNNITFIKHSLVLLHDISPIVGKQFFRKRTRLKAWLYAKTIGYNASKIVTVSKYQKILISKKLKRNLEDIELIYPGTEHISDILSDDTVFQKFIHIQKGSYYYALGSLAKHKNYKWVYEVAQRNPTKQFVVAGYMRTPKIVNTLEKSNNNNIIYLGYVSDQENKALLEHCKAFLQPSFMEGFAIPPLEAISLHKPVFLSNSSCLPEIYKGLASFFDPNDYSVNLDCFVLPDQQSYDKAMARYSWEKAGEKWIKLFEEKMRDYDV